MSRTSKATNDPFFINHPEILEELTRLSQKEEKACYGNDRGGSHYYDERQINLSALKLTDNDIKKLFEIIERDYPLLNDQITGISLKNNNLNQCPDVSQFRLLNFLDLVDNPLAELCEDTLPKGNEFVCRLSQEVWERPNLSNHPQNTVPSWKRVHELIDKLRKTPINPIVANPQSRFPIHPESYDEYKNLWNKMRKPLLPVPTIDTEHDEEEKYKKRRILLPVPTIDPEYDEEEKEFKARPEEHEQKFKFSQKNAEAKEATLALHSAVYFLDFEAIEQLLQKPEIKIDAKNEDGKTVFDIICSLPLALSTRKIIALLLTTKYADISDDEQSARAAVAKSIHALAPQYYPSKATGNTPLHHAVEIGNRAVIAELISLGINPEIKNSKGVIPAHIAAHRGDWDVVEMLVRASKHKLEQYGEVLRLAALNKKWELCDALLERGCPIVTAPGLDKALHRFTQNRHGSSQWLLKDKFLSKNEPVDIIPNCDTALHCFVRSNQLGLVKKAVQSQNCNINALGYDGQSALDIAASSHSVSADILETLLSRGDIGLNSKLSPLENAIRTRQPEKVAFLAKHPRTDLQASSSVDPYRHSLLALASQKGYDVLNAFLSAEHSRYSKQQWSAVFKSAAEKNETEICRCFMEHGFFSPSAIFDFIAHNNKELMELYDKRVNPEFVHKLMRDGETVLEYAMGCHFRKKWGYLYPTPETLRLLLKLFPYNFNEEKNNELIEKAIRNGIYHNNWGKVEALLKAGASVSICRNCSPRAKMVLTLIQTEENLMSVGNIFLKHSQQSYLDIFLAFIFLESCGEKKREMKENIERRLGVRDRTYLSSKNLSCALLLNDQEAIQSLVQFFQEQKNDVAALFFNLMKKEPDLELFKTIHPAENFHAIIENWINHFAKSDKSISEKMRFLCVQLQNAIKQAKPGEDISSYIFGMFVIAGLRTQAFGDTTYLSFQKGITRSSFCLGEIKDFNGMFTSDWCFETKFGLFKKRISTTVGTSTPHSSTAQVRKTLSSVLREADAPPASLPTHNPDYRSLANDERSIHFFLKSPYLLIGKQTKSDEGTEMRELPLSRMESCRESSKDDETTSSEKTKPQEPISKRSAGLVSAT